LCNQVRSFLRKFAAEDSGYVEQRSTAADQTNVMRTVANHIALGAQNSILQRDAVENPATLGRNSTRTIHHSTSGERYVILMIPCSLPSLMHLHRHVSRSQTPAWLRIDGVHEHSIDPSHDPIGPLHSGCNQRLCPRTWPAIVQILGAFQMTGDQYPGDDA
jgi:hypothetical protein